MNTSDSVYGRGRPEVRVATDEDKEIYPTYSPPEKHGHVVTTANTYDDMESDEDPVPTQELVATSYHAVIDVKGSGLELKPVNSFVLATDGTLVAMDGDGDTVDEIEGYRGIIHHEDPRQLSAEEVEALLNETRL